MFGSDAEQGRAAMPTSAFAQPKRERTSLLLQMMLGMRPQVLQSSVTTDWQTHIPSGKRRLGNVELFRRLENAPPLCGG